MSFITVTLFFLLAITVFNHSDKRAVVGNVERGIHKVLHHLQNYKKTL